jgi:hypothetical protein
MAIKVAGFDGNPFDQRSIIGGFARFITTMYLLVFSGSYTTGIGGGDTIDWTNGGVNSAVPSAQSFQTIGPIRTDVDDDGPSTGVLAAGGGYIIIPGTNLTNWKIKIFATAGTELGTGAYPSSVTSDTVLLRCDWAR